MKNIITMLISQSFWVLNQSLRPRGLRARDGLLGGRVRERHRAPERALRPPDLKSAEWETPPGRLEV